MAIVYKAYDTRLKTDAAVKFILAENLPETGVDRALKRFEREVELLARLTHPSSVPLSIMGNSKAIPTW
jgi:serine/threonine protein kinase